MLALQKQNLKNNEEILKQIQETDGEMENIINESKKENK